MDRKEVKIPLERVAVLIGKDGEVKKTIEQTMKVRLEIDSKEGDVIIQGEDSVAVYETVPIIKAIARGFNPLIAFNLFDEKYSFDYVNITNYVGNVKKHLMRVKGRIIGREGKARKMIEKATEVNISVYGKTIGIVGKYESVAAAKQAIEMLLEGAPHGNVFKWLETKKREMMRKQFEKNPTFF
jgi:ribosomal RNA assembly protein